MYDPADGDDLLDKLASLQPNIDSALEALAQPASEPVAYMVFWGIGEMRPHYPAYNTREIAEYSASQIKSNTEIRPLYTNIAQPVQPAAVAQAEPLSDEQIYTLFSSIKSALFAINGGSAGIPASRRCIVRAVELAHGIICKQAEAVTL